MRRIVLLCLLASAFAQTHTFPALDTNNVFTGTNSFQAITALSVNGVLNAADFSGSDILAQANAAVTSLGGLPGVVQIPAGEYFGVTTTLNAATGVNFIVQGVKVHFVGTSGCVLSVKNTVDSGFYGHLIILGPNAGSGTGLCLGNGTINTGQTLHNSFEDIEIGGDDATVTTAGFLHGVTCTGNSGAGTYDNHFRNVHVYASLGTQWVFQPAANEFCNINVIDNGYAQHGASDGLLLDGAYGNVFNGFRAETNSGWGVNIGTTQETDFNVFNGGWLESNTSGDFNCSNNHVNYTYAKGTNVSDSAGGGVSPNCNPALGGGATNVGNDFDVVNITTNAGAQKFGWGWTYSVNPSTANGKTIFQFFNSDTPPSTITQVFAWIRTSANNGSMQIASPEYPLFVNGTARFAAPIGSSGTAAVLTGTGACATFSNQAGGSWAGTAKCTGTTGASTLTIAPGITAPNGWICSVYDETTRANLLQQTSHSSTSCTLTATSVTSNDVFVFQATYF